MDLSVRSQEKEVIDFPESMSAQEVEGMLGELRLVNRWLGGSRAGLAPLGKWIQNLRAKRSVQILDVGSGGADIPRDLAAWGRAHGVEVCVTALDNNLQACRVAKHDSQGFPEIAVLQADVHQLPFADKRFDLSVCSAFLHHFSQSEIVSILRGLARVSRSGVIINDLHRHRLAYWGIRLLTILFSRSAAVRHDGPLSVRKGFRRSDLEGILQQAGLGRCSIQWRWAFRWVVTIRLESEGFTQRRRDANEKR